MAITGLLSGFNEQRSADVNYLAQLDQMRRAQLALDMQRQQQENQKLQQQQEFQFRQEQADQQADDRANAQYDQLGQSLLGQATGALSKGFADMSASSARAPQEMMQMAQIQRQSKTRNALADLINGEEEVNISDIGRAILPYDPPTGINLIKAGKEELRQQALLDRTGGTGVSAPQNYRWTKDGNLEPIPGGAADPRVMAQLEAIKSGGKTSKQTEATQQKVSDAQDVLGLLDMAEPFVDKATHSLVGQGVDWLGKAFGIGTEGAQASARLSAIEGMLVSKMPKMSGPQSDKDVLLYKQMAGQIGDASVPPEVKRAAMDTIRQINERYAGGAQSAGQSGQTFSAPPDPRQYKGRTIRDPATGMRMTSNGSDWVRAQ